MWSSIGDIYSNRPLWGEWYIGDMLEEDYCGTLHAVTRGKGGPRHSSVIKVCRFPSETLSLKAGSIFKNDTAKISRHFEERLEEIIYRLHLLSSMSNHGSIVNYYDYKIDIPEEGPGRIVIFRKDQVVPFAQYMQDHPTAKGEVIRLGKELCEALSYHLKRGTAQGYLRLENVFVSQEGAFKLGDTFEGDLLGGQVPAPPLFAAPEVLLGENFDHTADIYTLGLIMYKLLNEGRLPFMPSPSVKLEPREIKRALAQRVRKRPLPPPTLAGADLGSLVLKACSDEPSRRYTTPLEMKEALENLAPDLKEELSRFRAQTPEPSAPGDDVASVPTAPEEPEEPLEEQAPEGPSLEPAEQQETAHEPEPKVPPRTVLPGHVKYIAAAGLLLLAAVVVLLLLFYHRPASPGEPSGGDGNTAGNINNRGLAVLHDDGYLYYADPAEGSVICRSSPDGGDKSRLGDSHALYLNVADDWIYYVNSDSFSQVYKMRTDGSDDQQFISDSVSFILMSGGLLYYANRSDFSCLYRVDLDGNEPTRLNGEPTVHANISGQWIYYLNKEDKHIYRMRLDGSAKTRLNQDQSADIQVVGGWIYYRNISDNWRLYRMSTAGTGSDRLTWDPVYQFNVDGKGGIFFTNGSDGKSLYRLIVDEAVRSTEQVKLNDDSTSDLNMAGDWIYYINESKGGNLYRISPDGAGRAAVK